MLVAFKLFTEGQLERRVALLLELRDPRSLVTHDRVARGKIVWKSEFHRHAGIIKSPSKKRKRHFGSCTIF